MKHVVMHMEEAGLGLWNTMLQKGVGIQTRMGTSVAAFLEGQLGMDGEYVENVVRTIFVNGNPVDDIESASLGEGDVLALAGAMPGLVGIAMGRESPVAVFREDISRKIENVLETDETVMVTVKAFNVVAQTAGAELMHHGVIVSTDDLISYLGDRRRYFNDTVRTVDLEGESSSLADLAAGLGDGEIVSLRVLAR